jgi:hypothetical protein
MRDFFERYERFIIPEPNSGCWLWTGTCTPGRKSAGVGYGWFRRSKKMIYAHRASYECTHGDGSAAGLMVRHSCDLPLCVNPDHLLLGTNADNMQDMRERGRSNKGVKNGACILSTGAVQAIKGMRDAKVPQHEIGRQFGISQSAVSLIINEKRWAEHRKNRVTDHD